MCGAVLAVLAATAATAGAGAEAPVPAAIGQGSGGAGGLLDGPVLGERFRLQTPQQVDRAFRRAIALIEGGRPAEAIPVLRAILARVPRAPRVRLELARALFLDRKFGDSREQFQIVLSGGVPDQVRRNVLRFIRQIDARRGFAWDFQAGLSLSSDAGRSFDTDTVTIIDPISGDEVEGRVVRTDPPAFVLSFSGGVEYREALGEVGGARLVGFVEGDAELDEGPGVDGDSFFLVGQVGTRLIWPQTTLEIGPAVSTQVERLDPIEDIATLNADIEYRTESGFSYGATGAVGGVRERFGAKQEGLQAEAGMRVTRSFGSRAAVALLLSGERRDVGAPDRNYWDANARVVGILEIEGGFTFDAALFVENRLFDGIGAVIPERRRDVEFGGDVTVTKNDLFLLGRFSPFVSVGLSRRE
ncbi:MAG: tetratricopeptide repeat protein, partial [Pseudomonadota bacterium]